MKRVWVALGAVVLAVGGVGVVPAAAEVGRPGVVWGECPPDPGPGPRLRCAELEVPLDYRAPGGKKIKLTISRLASAKPGLRRGVLLHNGGGPGEPSLFLPSRYALAYSTEVLQRYDLIGFDPRGVGYSTPITCGRSPEELPNEWVLPFPAPDGSIAGNVRFAGELAADCLTGDVVRQVTTANTARDMDRIRIALGERKISYSSGSYGSYLGAVYASLFPERTDRIVLDSNVDPNRVWHRQWSLWDSGAEARFRDFAAWAVRQGGFGTTEAEVRARFLALAGELDRRPVTHPEAGPVNGNLFRAIHRAYSYHTLYFPELGAWWHFLTGDGPPPGWGEPPNVPGIPRDNSTAVLLAVTCGDANWPRDPGVYQREVLANRAKFPILGGMGANIWPCAFWSAPVEPPVRVSDRGPANILLLQTRRDPATPYAGALGMRAALGGRARMVTVNTGNHGAYDPSTPSCAVTEAHRFLVTGVLPRRDLACEPDAPGTGGVRAPLSVSPLSDGVRQIGYIWP
ncbi:pimeloyl-ACP methyl ester carboxylesterase [Actinokineospora baliensis]|uniref:alpha/beta hydrolase n=1 Tax=Actinokineospora baliensis TaxID=547056 RepID=UPI00195A21D3|nr:alpha/beta hydrolase [Actinokineospora baliensis]MBM7773278.1 pimeloyl-ACP methyl ester carboxylesterase [Actinokineospora baliensis]